MTTTSDPAAMPPAITPNDPDPAPPALATDSGHRPAPARPSTWTLLRPVLLRVHFFAGVLVAPFLAVLCLTGLAYVFSPQLADLAYREQFLVDQPGGTSRPLADQVAAALAATPGAALSSVAPPTAPDRTTEVALSVPGLPEGAGRTVYINPYTAEVQGSLPTLHGEPPLQSVLRNLHGDLLLGDTGRLYSEFAASWLPVLFAGGLILWWSQRRGRRRARALLLPPSRVRPGRGRIRGWHGSVGVWLAVGLVFISITGLTWSQYAGTRFENIITALDGRSATLAATPVAVEEGGTAIPVDRALSSARAAGLTGPVTITAPVEPGAPYTVAESSPSWPVQRDKVAVHPYTGQVSEQVRWGDNPVLAKLTTIGILAHTGTLFGLVNQIALAAMASGLLAVLFWGYRMWWLRRPTRATGSRFSAPAPRGSLRQLPQPVLFLIVVGTVALGWVLPVLGVSLLLFLAADQLWLRIRQRRTQRPPAPPAPEASAAPPATPPVPESDDPVLLRQS
jgi:uncharacterized iron-regulated membrane protein